MYSDCDAPLDTCAEEEACGSFIVEPIKLVVYGKVTEI
jgi:hypothetical protein